MRRRSVEREQASILTGTARRPTSRAHVVVTQGRPVASVRGSPSYIRPPLGVAGSFPSKRRRHERSSAFFVVKRHIYDTDGARFDPNSRKRDNRTALSRLHLHPEAPPGFEPGIKDLQFHVRGSRPYQAVTNPCSNDAPTALSFQPVAPSCSRICTGRCTLPALAFCFLLLE